MARRRHGLCSCPMVGAMLVGALLGMLVTACVNTMMLGVAESRNSFVMVACVSGSMMFLGVVALRRSIPIASRLRFGWFVITVASITLLAGVLAILQTIVRPSLPLGVRMVEYSVIGIGTSFATCFGLVDLVNRCILAAHSPPPDPWLPPAAHAPAARSAVLPNLVSSPIAVVLLAQASAFLGLACGVVFSSTRASMLGSDGTESQASERVQFLREEDYLLPLGALLGAAFSAINEAVRQAHTRRRGKGLLSAMRGGEFPDGDGPSDAFDDGFESDDSIEEVLNKFGDFVYGPPAYRR